MNKEEYIKIVKSKLSGKPKKIMLEQIENYYDAKNSEYISQNRFENGENVLLKKGTLLHGTYKNIEGLKSILDDGLISSWFTYGRLSKYPSSVGVWNLKEDCLLKDYINFYSGGTIEYKNFDGKKIKTSVIPYNEMKNIMNVIDTDQCFRWFIEQTKEARFMPSLVQNLVQIGIIFDNNNKDNSNIQTHIYKKNKKDTPAWPQVFNIQKRQPTLPFCLQAFCYVPASKESASNRSVPGRQKYKRYVTGQFVRNFCTNHRCTIYKMRRTR